MKTPDRFRAFVAQRTGERGAERVERGVRELGLDDLPAGDVTIAVEWSGVNYKDGLATLANGKVARISPLIPGVDLAGRVLESSDPSLPVGTGVLAHGYDLGVARHGGWTEIQRVPAGWIVPLPPGLSARDAMAIGTAGFTAALAVARLEAHGLEPADGPILVTGATGGVGRSALGILADRGYEVWAATGKSDETRRLTSLGAAGVLDRSEVTAESPRPLEHERWAGAIDCVGGPALPYILRTLRHGAAVAATGNVGGPTFETTVFPFILRDVALIGVDSVPVPIRERRELWNRIATDLRPKALDQLATDEVGLDGLEGAIESILAGRMRGRTVVRIGAR